MGISAAVVGGTLFSLNEQREARQEQKKANALAERAEAVRAQRERVRSIRSQRLQMATATAGAAGSGTLGASTFQGAIGSFQSEGAAQMNFVNTVNDLTGQQLAAQNRAAQNMAMANLYSGIGSLAGAFMRPTPQNTQAAQVRAAQLPEN